MSRAMGPGARWVAAWALLVLFVLLASSGVWGRWIDVNLLHESLKDRWGTWVHHEDWQTLAPIPAGLDASWLEASRAGTLRIAHALGESGEDGADSLEALRRSARQGFRLFEVDLYLDEGGRLRCHHGPDAPPPFNPERDCTFDKLVPLVASADGWLVLDIKSDFIEVADRVAAQLHDPELARRVIFQLYRPSDVQWFSRVAPALKLARPIITAYAAKRSVDHVAAQARRLGVAAFTMPVHKLPALSANPGVPLLVHPVHTCDDWRRARAQPIDGIYTLSRFDEALCGR